VGRGPRLTPYQLVARGRERLHQIPAAWLNGPATGADRTERRQEIEKAAGFFVDADEPGLQRVRARKFLQQRVQLVNPRLYPGDSRLRRAVGNVCSRTYISRFEHFELPLERRAYLDPFLNQMFDLSHEFSSPDCR
jgi:hypothetical protein